MWGIIGCAALSGNSVRINTVEISGLSDITPAGTVITEPQTFRYGSPGPIADSAPLEAPSLEGGGNFVLRCCQPRPELAASPEHRPPRWRRLRAAFAKASLCHRSRAMTPTPLRHSVSLLQALTLISCAVKVQKRGGKKTPQNGVRLCFPLCFPLCWRLRFGPVVVGI